MAQQKAAADPLDRRLAQAQCLRESMALSESKAPSASGRLSLTLDSQKQYNEMHNILIVIGTILILFYLLISRNLWFPRLEEQVQISKDCLTKQIDLSSPKTITWKIQEDDWSYTGEVRVALVVDNHPDIPRESYKKETMDLKVKVDAFAITYQSTNSGRKEVLRANRLIKNWYFITDMPLSPDARIWESGGGSTIEYGLCGMQRYLWEDTYIAVTIESADPLLNKANPRLEVVGDHDYAVFGHIGGMRIFRDIILICLALTSMAICYQLKFRSSK